VCPADAKLHVSWRFNFSTIIGIAKTPRFLNIQNRLFVQYVYVPCFPAIEKV